MLGRFHFPLLFLPPPVVCALLGHHRLSAEVSTHSRQPGPTASVIGAMADELLGAGLDIDGWTFLKQELGRSVADLTDKSYVHKQMIPLMIRWTKRGLFS